MNRVKLPLLTAALALATAFTLSCSSDDSGGSGSNGDNAIKKAKISGVSQKGPFVEGSTATLYELNDNFVQTGRGFPDRIADNKGTFEIKDIELVSPYAMLEADGFYRNEVTGQISAAPIKLYAIADVREKDNINVNLLTHLEYYRVLNLVGSGKTIAEAKKQAQKEILAVFGINSDGFKDSEDMSIFGTSESDAALLAISVLLQGDLSEGLFSQRLTNFSQAIRNGGTPDESVMAAMADWAAGADLSGIRNSILSWGLSSDVPDFGKYVYDYWVSGYGLGNCDAGSRNDIKTSNGGVYYACKGKGWEAARYIDIKCFESGACLTFTDARDGRSYFSVEIGEQTWMAENLNYNADGSRCYNDDEAYCDVYGRLYDWETATTVCPSGWHLPSDEEWDVLISAVGGYSTAGTKLKSSSGWSRLNNTYDVPVGTDDYGFAAIPSGRGHSGSNFEGAGFDGRWWSTDETGAYRHMSYLDERVGSSVDNTSLVLHSVRCLLGD